jgi:hypothetical protein
MRSISILLGFGSASASSQGIKEAANPSNDLHSILFKTFPKLPFWLAERQLASPFLTLPANFASLKLGPSNGAIFLNLAEAAKEEP